MAEDTTSRISLEVDSTDVGSAAENLDRFAASGTKAEAVTQALAATAKRNAAATAEMSVVQSRFVTATGQSEGIVGKLGAAFDALNGSTAGVARGIASIGAAKLPATSGLGNLAKEALAAGSSAKEAAAEYVAAIQKAKQAAAEADKAQASAASRQEFLQSLREEIKLLGMSEAAQREYLRAKQLASAQVAGGDEGRALQRILLDQAAAQDKAAKAARDEAQAQREASAAKRGNDEYIAFVKRQSDAIGKTRADLLEMEAAQRGLAAQTAPYIQKLREADNATRALGAGQNLTAQQAQQLSFQLNDLFVQIASGGSPLTALIQQVSQLNGTFGGIRGTINAIGSVFTPLRVALGGAAAVLGVLALGYKKGAEEGDEFVRSIVLTGNAAGITVGQLQAMSAAVAASGGTQGKAAEVLARFAASAKISAAELIKVSAAAIGLERVGGPAIEKTAAQFESLAKNPAQASLALNEATNFLTASLYEQIRALEDQGRVSEAAALAQARFADVLSSRKAELEANLDSIERGWLAIKDAVKGAADAILNIGRTTSTDSQRQTLQTELADREKRGPLNPAAADSFEKGNARLREQIALLNKAAFAETERAGRAVLVNESEKAGIALAQRREGLLDNEAKKKREIAAIQTDAAKSRLGGSKPISTEDESKLIDAVNKKYTERKAKGEDLDKIYGQLIASSREHQAAMALEAAGTEKLTQGEKRLLDVQAKIEEGTLTYNKALYARVAAELTAEATAERADNARQEALKRIEKAREAAAKSAKSQFDLEERANDSLERSGKALTEQIDKLNLGEEAYGLREAATLRAQAAELLLNAAVEGGNPVFEDRVALLQANADKLAARNVAAFEKSLRDEAVALGETNQLLALEASLIGKSRDERALAIQQLQIELKMKRDIARIKAGTEPGPQRDKLIGDTVAQAADASKALASKQNIDRLADLFDPDRVKNFGSALRDAFEGASEGFKRTTSALSGLVDLFGDYAKQQQDLDKGFKANRKPDGSISDLKTENDLIQEQGDLRMRSYIDAAGAAKGFFAEGSKGYATMQAIEAAFTIASIAQSFARGTAAAAEVVAGQAKGDPYTAFARMAAMAAAMASLGFAVSSIRGGSKSGTASAEARQGGAATGKVVTADQANSASVVFVRGTVLGDDTAKSESIANALEALEDTAKIELSYSRNALNALESIRDSMAGLASLVARSAGITTGEGLGLIEGSTPYQDKIGIAVPNAIGDKLTSAALTAFDKVLGPLWGKVKTEIVDSGLEILGNLNDVVVQQYADGATTKSSFFGLVKKTTEENVTGPVEKQVADQFSLIFRSIGDTLTDAAAFLGRDGATFQTALDSFEIKLPRLSLKDLKGDELQDAISAAIGGVADELAVKALPGLSAFQQVGEGYYETLIRVASGIEVANYELELLGISAIDYTNVIRKQGDVTAEIVRQSIAAAESATGQLSSVGEIVNTLSGSGDDIVETYRALIDVRTALINVGESGEALTVAMIRGAGGLDNLAGSLETFFDEFFTDNERLSANAATLNAEFTKLGLSMPGTRDEFKTLATSLNDGTDAGAALYAKVIGLSAAFDEVADSAEEATKALTDAIRDNRSRFGTPDEKRFAAVQPIRAELQSVGVNLSIGDLLGATQAQIQAFLSAFVELGTNADDAKTAVVKAAAALLDLREQAAGKSGDLEIELRRALGNELGAVQLERAKEIASLVALEASLGVAAGSFTTLQNEIYAATDAVNKVADAARILSGLDSIIGDFISGVELAKFRASRIQTTLSGAGINVSIEDIMGATTDEIVGLWHSVGDAGKQAILDSYGALTQLQTDLTKEQRKSIEDQITGMKGLRDLARDIAQFTASLKFSDLSPLSAPDQLAQAQALFDTTLAKAGDGDTKAQGALLGNAQAYLQELSEAFASGPAFTREFDRVTGLLDELGLKGEALDPQIKLLEDIFGNDRKMLDALLSIDGTLKGETQAADLGAAPDAGSRYALPDATEGGLQVATAPTKTAELLQLQIEHLTATVAELRAQTTALNAIATISQAAARSNSAGLEAVRQPLQEIADIERLKR